MQFLIMSSICIVMSAAYLVVLGAPQPVKFLPELMSAVAFIYVALAGMRNRFELVRTQYWLVFGAITLFIICGILANTVAPGPIVAGLRYYIRAIPFFFLPAVYPFKEWQIKQQFTLLCAFAVLQLPLAIYQKYTLLQEGFATGDPVYGTLMLSPTLTIFLLGAICFILALTLRGRLSKPLFGLLFILFLLPTTINETKITVFLLPLCIIITMMVVAPRGGRLKMLGVSVVLMTVALAIFVPIYDYLGKQNVSTVDAYSVSDMFTKKDYFKKYLDQETAVGDKKKDVGRVDAFLVPLGVISEDPVLTAFGLGIGNASISNIGAQFSGEYSATLGKYASGAPSAGAILLEIGALGLICVYALHWLILGDALKVARGSTDVVGILAASWPAVVVMYSITFFYTAPIAYESLSYLFWYFSGLIAARRVQLAVQTREAMKKLPTAYPSKARTAGRSLG